MPGTFYVEPEPLIVAGQAIVKEAAALLAAHGCNDAQGDVVQGRGNTGTRIAQYADDHGCTQIVMSARGHTPLTHLLLGSASDSWVTTSTTNRVAAVAIPCPGEEDAS